MMHKVALCTLALVMVAGLAGCKKAPSSPQKPGNDPGAPAVKGTSGGMGTVGGMDTASPAGGTLTSAAAACQKDAARPGKTFTTNEYAVAIAAPAAATRGQATEAVVTVTPKGGYKLNLKYDHELTLKRLTAGVRPERKTYGNKEAAQRDKAGLKFVVKYTGSATGKQVLQGVLDFSVCTPKLCVNKDDLCVSWESTVK